LHRLAAGEIKLRVGRNYLRTKNRKGKNREMFFHKVGWFRSVKWRNIFHKSSKNIFEKCHNFGARHKCRFTVQNN